MNGEAGNGRSAPPRPALIAWDSWLKQIGRTHTTGWRWRKAGWIEVLNVAGRLYVSDSAIAAFVRRAEAGEFAKEHKTPPRTAVAS